MIAIQNDTDAKYPFKLKNKLCGQASQNFKRTADFQKCSNNDVKK